MANEEHLRTAGLKDS